MAPSVEMNVASKGSGNQQADEAKDAKVTVWDTESDVAKSPKSISWYVIFASALANFSDGYQNNLVSIFSETFVWKFIARLTQNQ